MFGRRIPVTDTLNCRREKPGHVGLQGEGQQKVDGFAGART